MKFQNPKVVAQARLSYTSGFGEKFEVFLPYTGMAAIFIVFKTI